MRMEAEAQAEMQAGRLLYDNFRGARTDVEREDVLTAINNLADECPHGSVLFLKARCNLQMAVSDMLAQLHGIDLVQLLGGLEANLKFQKLHQLCSVALEASLKGSAVHPDCAVFHAELSWAIGTPPPANEGTAPAV